MPRGACVKAIFLLVNDEGSGRVEERHILVIAAVVLHPLHDPDTIHFYLALIGCVTL